ncbi:MAG: phosphoenolpyruvate--protein phosphotransferase [Treponema sp.]|nr:phosphoenolpyruvate--protein phosphotransferase [Treponema sp.]
MEILSGKAAAKGTGIGTAFVIPEPVKRTIPRHTRSENALEKEWTLFTDSKETVLNRLCNLLNSLSKTEQNDVLQRQVFEAYVLMLQDEFFIKEIKTFYEANEFNIFHSVDLKTKEYAEKLKQSNDEYLSQRAADILDVYSMVLDEMLDIHPFDINTVPDNSIIAADFLSSADTIILSKRKIKGLILNETGENSHVIILARSYGIPAIIGIENISKKIKTGETVIIDTNDSKIIISPEKTIIEEYKQKLQEEQKHHEELKQYLNKPAVTKNGTKFTLLANIGTIEEAELAKENNADGIGLFRTEFLFMERTDLPATDQNRKINEDEQFEIYKQVLQIMGNKPVTIRTLDAGGDKIIKSQNIPSIEEKNPLMGLRAVRLTLKYPSLLKTQLRALYRASIFGNLKIMFPLITHYNQLEECMKIINEVKTELKKENIKYNDVPVGIMIETASAALTSDSLSRLSDFFSIGTNDLTQYTLAVDRENQSVSNLYNELDPAVLKLIKMTVTSAKDAGIELCVCGEMAGKKNCIMILGGMGIRTLSLSPNLIFETKEFLSKTDISEMEKLAEGIR